MKGLGRFLRARLARVLLAAVAAGVLGFPAAASAQGFVEDFSAPALGPEWTVVPGMRIASGFGPPANDYSLTANPGHLRYSLNPMTHSDGFLNGYQPSFGYHSCCTHDPGLELHRSFGGTDWTFEADTGYFLPFTNGRHFDTRVYFGGGGVGTVYVALQRGRDVHPINYVRAMLVVKTGPALGDHVVLEDSFANHFCPSGGCDSTQVFWRLERAGNVLTATWSDDGVTWNAAWSHDVGPALDLLAQRVVLAGLSWFNSAGSYADYDGVRVLPTNSCGELRGDGLLASNPDAFFSFYHVKYETGAAAPSGEISFTDRSTSPRTRFVSTAIASLVFDGSLARASGTGLVNGEPVEFVVEAVDGKPDTFSLRLSNGFEASGDVRRGRGVNVKPC